MIGMQLPVTQDYVAALGELDRIADVVHQCLRQACAVAVKQAGRCRGFDDQAQSLVVSDRSEHVGNAENQVGKIDRLFNQEVSLPKRRSSKIEDVVDDCQQVLGREVDLGKSVGLFVGQAVACAIR